MKEPTPESNQLVSDYRNQVQDWMRLMQGAVMATQQDYGYVIDIISESCEKIDGVECKLSTKEIETLIRRVNTALRHAEFQEEQRERLRLDECNKRSRIVEKLEDDVINNARIRIENRMFRAPIILVPLVLLITAMMFAVTGVIDIKGQKLDVNEIVNKTVNKLTADIDNEGNKALDIINGKLEEKSKEIEEFDVQTRIGNAVSLHVADNGKNTLEIIKNKLIEFESDFPDKVLSEAISEVGRANEMATALEGRIGMLEQELLETSELVTPLGEALDKIKESDPNSLKTIADIMEGSRWSLYAGVAGLAGLLMGLASLILSIVVILKYRKTRAKNIQPVS